MNKLFISFGFFLKVKFIESKIYRRKINKIFLTYSFRTKYFTKKWLKNDHLEVFRKVK